MIALAAPCVSTSSPNYATRCANAAQRALTSACWAASTQFEKRSTTSGRGDSQRSALALGRVLQACSEVVARQLLELFEQLIPRRATGQIPEDIPDLDASSRDAGLPEPDGGIDADALEEAHARKCAAAETKTVKLIRRRPDE
jgi:hypothetical protein